MYSKVRLEAYLVIVCNLPLYSNLRIYMRKTIVKYYEPDKYEEKPSPLEMCAEANQAFLTQ